jgi:molybdopterin-guanine dinucleotide biosynthesis protein A
VKNVFCQLLQFYSVSIIEDRHPGRGPIEGLYTGLNAMSSEWGFLIGCDMPSPQEKVIHYMWNRTIELSEEYKVSAACIDDYIMPLHAFYHKDCSYNINSLIEYVESECNAMEGDDGLQSPSEGKGFNSRLKLKSFYCSTKVNIISESELATIPGWRKSFTGFNTLEELKSALIHNLI